MLTFILSFDMTYYADTAAWFVHNSAGSRTHRHDCDVPGKLASLCALVSTQPRTLSSSSSSTGSTGAGGGAGIQWHYH